VSFSNDRDRIRDKLSWNSSREWVAGPSSCRGQSSERGSLLWDQRLAQPGTDREHHNRIVDQERMLLQQAQQIGRSGFGKAFKLV